MKVNPVKMQFESDITHSHSVHRDSLDKSAKLTKDQKHFSTQAAMFKLDESKVQTIRELLTPLWTIGAKENQYNELDRYIEGCGANGTTKVDSENTRGTGVRIRFRS